jgi:hypothetical protein
MGRVGVNMGAKMRRFRQRIEVSCRRAGELNLAGANYKDGADGRPFAEEQRSFLKQQLLANRRELKQSVLVQIAEGPGRPKFTTHAFMWTAIIEWGTIPESTSESHQEQSQCLRTGASCVKYMPLL